MAVDSAGRAMMAPIALSVSTTTGPGVRLFNVAAPDNEAASDNLS